MAAPSGGAYSDTDYDRARAFLVLAHAELEAYLEEMALTIVDEAITKWRRDKRARAPILSLLAYWPKTVQPPPEKRDTTNPSLLEAIDTAKKQFSRFVTQENHGIKESNVLALLLPVGIRESQLNEAWLVEMNNLGSERGEVAHAELAAYSPPDPADVRNRMNAVLLGLASVDRTLVTLMSEPSGVE